MTAFNVASLEPADTSNGPRPFNLLIDSTPMAVRHALKNIDHHLASLALSPDICGSVQLVLAEVMNNIVEHAYADMSGTIRMRLCRTPEHLLCHLTDSGHPMPNTDLPEGQAACENTALHDLAEGGFGWLLIREFAEYLEYKRIDGMNHLRFTISTK